ncbi:MAG: hypothetical protein ACK54C_12020 [Betaproteobacteria bacterium]|jgi:hypothetical protein
MATKKKAATKAGTAKSAKKAAKAGPQRGAKAATKRPAQPPAKKGGASTSPITSDEWKRPLNAAVTELNDLKQRLVAAGVAGEEAAVNHVISLIKEALASPPGNVGSGSKTKSGGQGN